MAWRLWSVLLALATMFSLIAQAQAPRAFGEGEYSLGPEDVLEVWIWKEPDLSTTVVVRPDGKISLPLTGELHAAGKSVLQLQEEIRTKLRGFISDPVVTVIVKEINSPKVSVLGKVHRPDVYKIKQKTTVLDAIAMAGGFTEFAKRDRVTVIRNNSTQQQRFPIDLERPNEEGRPFYLQPSDTVYVE
jgi:polysaccharide export outer membrane protein